MLRISGKDEKIIEEFQRVHPEAKKKGFGRVFRSPTLFEDMVKSVLLCCAPWKRSLEMAEALCDLQFKNKRRRYSSNNYCCKECDEWGIISYGNYFPSPKEIANFVDEETLNKKCNLGYRASIILHLARSIENGTIKIAEFEEEEEEKLFLKLNKIKGFGPFTVANIMMCIGFYRHIPVDTETIKHLHKVHGVESSKMRKKRQREEVIADIYGKYGPFKCLAYWMEHVEYYENIVGKLSELPHSQYSNVTTPNL
ncbi:hypothetical protein BUALT_Bualt17G0001500 [Buddleja alternifolia]|uniref:HhH-GPD domain-containing protein n=1 Tax=Buddleja alternifolia TaxID=168488 RepID=A0AAV6WBB2_9LAMI|nr:hypothetical protein BUALT_Bualt17G0001500 [Buddleja alternifolia]